MNIFESVVKQQFHVNNPARMAEFTERTFDSALSECGPTQLNIPRDYFYGSNDFTIRGRIFFSPPLRPTCVLRGSCPEYRAQRIVLEGGSLGGVAPGGRSRGSLGGVARGGWGSL